MTYKGSVKRRVRKLCLEQIGEDKPFDVEIELAESGIKLSQLKTQYIYDWSTVVEIEETEDPVYFYRSDGTGLAVRKRGFESKAKQEEFIKVARGYANTALIR